MKKLKNKSIYIKFVLIFLSIWWILNAVTLGLIIHNISRSNIVDLVQDKEVIHAKMENLRNKTSLTFLIISTLGTVIIITTVKKIVQPIKDLSNASKKIASGNFNIELVPVADDEVGRLIKDFNTMAKELQHIDTMHKDFVNNISHEFRTPITAIKGYAKLIKDDQLSIEKKEEYSNIIITESDRLVKLSSDLLKLSELDNEEINYKYESFALDEQIRQAILFLEPLWNKKNITFELNLEKIAYYGIENLSWQVWINLIGNAIKFSKNDEIIIINLTNEKSYIKIEIIDHGIGISKENITKIFERFYKIDASRNSEGNGLGLTIVKKIINTLNGTIDIESIPNKETKVIVKLLKDKS